MQVGTRQLHFGGDVGHRGAAEALFGKNLFRPQQDFFDVTATNLDLVIAHADPRQQRCPRLASALDRGDRGKRNFVQPLS
ncbi:hypothetical protein D3C79_882900 [compost metagenome]